VARQLYWHEIRWWRKSEGGQKLGEFEGENFCPPMSAKGGLGIGFASPAPQAAGWQLKFCVGVFFKISSDFVQNTPPIRTS